MTNRFWAIFCVLASLTLLLPVGTAHGAVNARELEVLVLEDELSDVQTSTAGYDLGEFYVAEAWIAGLGDGLYFHTILFGSFPGNPSSSKYEVRFTMEDAAGNKLVRSIITTGGEELSTDFDLLEAEHEADQVEIERAFVKLDGTGWTRGARIKTFIVESYVDGEIRDRAPGPLYAPRSGGRLEIPQGDSRQTVEFLVLQGPVNYMRANFTRAETADTFVLNMTSALTKGAQHLHLETPEWALDDPTVTGWEFEILGPPGGEVAANGSSAVNFRLRPVPDEQGTVAPVMMNVTTDVGGRQGFQVRALGDGQVEFVPEQNVTSWSASTLRVAAAESPAGGGISWIALVVPVVIALGFRRRIR